MPAYEICYLDSRGALSYKFCANCESVEQATFLARAMKLPTCQFFEIWNGETLVYKRPPNLTVRAFGFRNGQPFLR